MLAKFSQKGSQNTRCYAFPRFSQSFSEQLIPQLDIGLSSMRGNFETTTTICKICHNSLSCQLKLGEIL